MSRPTRTTVPVVAALVVLAVAWPTARAELGVPPPIAFVLGLAAALPVAGVVVAPVPAWLLSAGGAVVVASTIGPRAGHPWPVAIVHGIVLLALLVAVVLGARWWEAAAASVLTALVFGLGVGSAGGPLWGLVVVPVLALAAWLARQLVASRRRLAASERASESERARRAVLEDRARLARDLHDVVAHSMSMIVVRAETAPYRLPALPEDARHELAEIGAAARTSLSEVRSLLGVLRDDAAAPRSPLPGLGDTDALLEQARAAGMTVSIDRRGGPFDLSDAAAVSLHRILAEALANAARHAAGAPVGVVLERAGPDVRLVVGNPPGTDGGPGAGVGVPGMRDRAAAVGGELTAGPGPDGGWRVAATLPRDAS